MKQIHRLSLPTFDFEPLRTEARAEGYGFVETTAREWASGANRFDGVGESLYGVFDGDVLVAMGGLAGDQFAGDPTVGRLRRIYVRARWRNQGTGTQLVQFLIEQARRHFRVVRLRAQNEAAAKLYERLGFEPISDPDATHVLHL